MKKIIIGALAVSAVVFAFASNPASVAGGEGCCAKEAKVVVKNEENCEGGVCKPGAKVEAKVAAKDGACCADKAGKVQVKMAAKDGACCADKAGKVQVKMAAKDGACCADKAGKVEVKMAGKEACCTSTAKAPKAKGEKGCCNAPGEMAKFKVFADGKWMFYGCKGSAEMGRKELMTMAFKVGQIMPVTGKVMMPSNQSLI